MCAREAAGATGLVVLGRQARGDGPEGPGKMPEHRTAHLGPALPTGTWLRGAQAEPPERPPQGQAQGPRLFSPSGQGLWLTEGYPCAWHCATLFRPQQPCKALKALLRGLRHRW